MNCLKLWNSGPPLASEDEALELVDACFARTGPHLPFGRGHDCAELAVGSPLALSVDFFLQDRHFRPEYFLPAEAGAKALASAVSDLAAAGAEPLGFALGLMLPDRPGRTTVLDALRGMSDLAAEYGLILAGGDLSGGDRFGFSVTVWGRSAVRGSNVFLRRDPVRQGDVIFIVARDGQTGAGNDCAPLGPVSGGCATPAPATPAPAAVPAPAGLAETNLAGPDMIPIGLAGTGLAVLEGQGRPTRTLWPEAVRAFLAPRPLVAEGRVLAGLKAGGCRISLMDLSDGLARDLPRLLRGLGADVDLRPGRIHPEVARYALERGLDPAVAAYLGGEDYALLGACAEKDWPLVARALPCGVSFLGRAGGAPGVRLNGRTADVKGFDHFSS